MENVINNKLIRSFSACYDPSEVVTDDNESLSVYEWILKYRDKVKSPEDIVWLICRKDFMSDRDIRLFAVWCARESFKLQSSVDQRSIDAVDMAEKFANNLATEEELSAARSAAESAAESAAWSAGSAASAAWSAASAAWSAAWSAGSAAESAAWSAESAAESAARSAQIDQLLTYFQSNIKE